MSASPGETPGQGLERRIGEAEAAHSQYLTELSMIAASSVTARAMFASVGSASDAEPAMTVLTDKSLPDETRVEVLRRLTSLVRRDEYVEALLTIVRDRDDSAAMRQAALHALGAAAFSVARFHPHEQQYDDMLHDLVIDPVPALRDTAVNILAQRHDPVVQDVLLNGLRGDGPLPVNRERAILLLAEDDHLDNLPWLHELYRGGSDGARQEAVRFMGSYPAAQTTLEDILRDRNEATGVRQQAGASLRYLALERYEAVAKEIATDPSDYPEIRAASLSVLHHLSDSDRIHTDADFLTRLQEVSGDESAPQVAQIARDLLDGRPNP